LARSVVFKRIEGNYTLNAIYFLIVILVYHTAYSLVGLPYDASMPEMAPETHARLGLSYWKGFFGIIGVMIGSLVAAPLFESIGAVATSDGGIHLHWISHIPKTPHW
jgi:Na+/melibiose symporter-like transporter